MTIDQKIDTIMSECGFLTHENKFISLELLRDKYLLLAAKDLDDFQTNIQISNLRSDANERHAERVRKCDKAHRARLTK